MGTEHLRPNGKVRHRTKGKMNVKHRAFADEFLENGMVIVKAARSLGYKNPGVMGNKILKRPEVKRYIETELTKLNRESLFRRAQLIAKLVRLNDFNLMAAAATSKGGFLEITPEKYEEVADEIGDCVTEVEFDSYEDDDGNKRTKIRIKLMSKEKMFETELRYRGLLEAEGINITQTLAIDWDEQSKREANPSNVIDGTVLPSTNGDGA